MGTVVRLRCEAGGAAQLQALGAPSDSCLGHEYGCAFQFAAAQACERCVRFREQ
jgi:hypothetical protein